MARQFEWHPDRPRRNLRKHRLSFEEATTVFEDNPVAHGVGSHPLRRRGALHAHRPCEAPMRHITRVVLAGLSASPWLHAAAQAVPSATAAATVAARPSDVASVDAIIAALYDANTILADQKRDADRFRSLFVPGARLMPTSGSGNGPQVIRILTVEDYVQRASSGPPRHGFSEREIVRTSEAFGNIVHVFSTYEMHRDSTDAHPARGINSIQLFTTAPAGGSSACCRTPSAPTSPYRPNSCPAAPSSP